MRMSNSDHIMLTALISFIVTGFIGNIVELNRLIFHFFIALPFVFAAVFMVLFYIRKDLLLRDAMSGETVEVSVYNSLMKIKNYVPCFTSDRRINNMLEMNPDDNVYISLTLPNLFNAKVDWIDICEKCKAFNTVKLFDVFFRGLSDGKTTYSLKSISKGVFLLVKSKEEEIINLTGDMIIEEKKPVEDKKEEVKKEPPVVYASSKTKALKSEFKKVGKLVNIQGKLYKYVRVKSNSGRKHLALQELS